MAEMIYLLLGSNEGDRLKLIKEAAHYLVLHLARAPVDYSSVYETAAWGKEDQPSFLNIAIGMQTTRPPQLVLAACRQIEASFGRQRTELWGQRTLDADIIFYGDKIIQSPELTIPHAQIEHRRFTLMPMAEIAPQLVHPVLSKTILQLLDECKDTLLVRAIAKIGDY